MFNFCFLKRFLLYLTHLITGGKYTGIRKTNICKCDINVIMLKVRKIVKSQNHFDLVIKTQLTCRHSDIQIGTTIASMQFNCKVKTENIVSFCTAMISTNVNRYYIIRSIFLIVWHHYKVHREEILHVVTWLVNEKLWKPNKNSTLL